MKFILPLQVVSFLLLSLLFSTQTLLAQNCGDPVKIEAEDFLFSHFIGNEDNVFFAQSNDPEDDSPTLRVRHLKHGSNIRFPDLAFNRTGKYRFNFRVATPVNGAKINVYVKRKTPLAQFIKAAEVTLPNTGGWSSNWQTISVNTGIDISIGLYEVMIESVDVPFSLNWWSYQCTIVNNPCRDIRVEAEDFDTNLSFFYGNEDNNFYAASNDPEGGGQRVRHFKNMTELRYPNVYFAGGFYGFRVRAATLVGGGKVAVYVDGNYITTTDVQDTDGWNTGWTTNIDPTYKVIEEGFHTVLLVAEGAPLSMNWWEFDCINENRQAAPTSSESFEVFPNPTSDFLSYSFNASEDSDVSMQIRSFDGKLIRQKHVAAMQGSNTFDLDTSQYAAGMYLITVINNKGKVMTKPFVIFRK